MAVSRPVIDNVNSAVHRFVQMWLHKMSLDDFALRCRIKRGTLDRWRHGVGSPKAEQIETMAHWLKCSYHVIIGKQPCLKKCSHCYLAQP